VNLRRYKVVLLVVTVALLGIAASGVYVFSLWHKPLGPALLYPTYTPSPQSVVSVPEGTLPPTQQTPAPPGTALAQATPGQPVATVAPPTATHAPLCGGPATMTILAIGSDERSTGYLYGLADSIHVIRVDFTVPNVMVIDFPRDLWVEIPGISEHHGITHGKLNQAYLYGNPGMGYYDGPGEGPGLLAQTLDVNYGLRVDHYLAVDLQTFEHMVDAIGGVDLVLDNSVDLNSSHGTPDPNLILPAGPHHLDGRLTLLLARNRVPSTFQRMKNQKIIMNALRVKLLTPTMLPRLPFLVAQFIGSVQTNLSFSEINSLMCISQQVPTENIKSDSFPQDMFTATVTYDENRNVTTFIYDVNNARLREMIAEFMNGIWPMP
jgi:LCP family protein required for cell wall assembly